MRPLQYFSKPYLEQCRQMNPGQIVRFLEDFRLLQNPKKPAKSRLISMKVPEQMLEAFKRKAQFNGIAYQTQIKKLMTEWLNSSI